MSEIFVPKGLAVLENSSSAQVSQSLLCTSVLCPSASAPHPLSLSTTLPTLFVPALGTLKVPHSLCSMTIAAALPPSQLPLLTAPQLMCLLLGFLLPFTTNGPEKGT